MNPIALMKALFTSGPCLSPANCAARVRQGGALLVDVREPAEWASGVAQSARLIPFSDLTGARTQWKGFLAEASGREVFLYCKSGGRAGMATKILAAEGVRAANTGGLSDWLAAGWPLVNPPKQP